MKGKLYKTKEWLVGAIKDTLVVAFYVFVALGISGGVLFLIVSEGWTR